MANPVQEGLDFLASLEFFGIKLGLEQTRELFSRIGNPHHSLRFIHVAGSNGKGSVCALLEAALRHAGFKTGFYSSPHLVRVGERFRINGREAGEAQVAACVEKLRPSIRAMAENGRKVTYFEATTAIAAMLFAEAGTDIVLWEVGMGGRLDSTNIVSPLASVITGISMEHADRLGGTLAKIGFEKAGIIKEGIPVFCAETTPPEAMKVIQTRARELHAPFFLSSPVDTASPAETGLAPDGSAALQSFRLTDGTKLTTPLTGPHQRRNAALAHAVLKHLALRLGFRLDTALEGFPLVRWDARFQLFPGRKLVLDGAHNPEGLQALADALREVFPGRKFHFLFGAFCDKDTAAGLSALAPLALSFRFIHMDTARASMSADGLRAQLDSILRGIPSGGTSLKDALETPPSDGGWRVLCGSLHLCGEALAILQ